VKILYENVNLLFFWNSTHPHITWMYFGNPPIPNNASSPHTYPFPPTPSPAKPCFRPGDTPALPSMHSTYIAVPTQRQNQDRNTPRSQHGNAAPWMSSHSRCFPPPVLCCLWHNIRCWHSSRNMCGSQTAPELMIHAVAILFQELQILPPWSMSLYPFPLCPIS
jgi:hypothetical protein